MPADGSSPAVQLIRLITDPVPGPSARVSQPDPPADDPGLSAPPEEP